MSVTILRHAVRADLHCHSIASNEADEALLNAIQCPESYSAPIEVYNQAKRRGMAFVTITDHDSIDGVSPLAAGKKDVIIGEEVTCYFPEDRCKIHLLVWGLSKADHDAIQAVADDIYKAAEYIEQHNLAHAVAHAVYRQNDVLERWHLERLALMFKGFEILNGAHSALHREALEPFIDELTPQRIEVLSRRHNLKARWPEPWVKARTAGSDDHGLFNVGRTWTEFPPEATTVEAVLQCLREARCRPCGEAGSSMKLAHNFFGVGIRYYARRLAPGTAAATWLGYLTGDRQPRARMAWLIARSWVQGLAGKIGRLFTGVKKPPTGAALWADVFNKTIRKQLAQTPVLQAAIRQGTSPLAEHQAIFDLVSALNRDVAEGVRHAVDHAVKHGELAGVFDAISTIAAHNFVMAPYYFALFHQNRERAVLARVTGYRSQRPMRVGIFTDTLDDVNGVGRFIATMVDQAGLRGAELTVHTCSATVRRQVASRKNFTPLVTLPMPFYNELSLNLPPLLEVLEWADRQQFDAIHVSTPGPMGLAGCLVAKMLRVPLITTYHTDFPKYVERLTGDYRLTSATKGYMTWFYNQATTVFCRSRSSMKELEALSIPSSIMALMPPSVDGENFSPVHRDLEHWQKLGVKEPHRILYAGRVSVEKNLPLMVTAFRNLCAMRSDTALVVAGDGPYLQQMRKEMAGLPVYFLGFQNDISLRTLFASSDLFAFPSRTDTLGQVVMEAQASGLPVLVSDEGGPKEMTDDTLTGLVLPSADSNAWTAAMNELLSDAPRRQRMARTAPTRMARFSAGPAFEAFWDAHARAAAEASAKASGEPSAPTPTVVAATEPPAQEPVAHAFAP